VAGDGAAVEEGEVDVVAAADGVDEGGAEKDVKSRVTMILTWGSLTN
jgi:hypothetical protein